MTLIASYSFDNGDVRDLSGRGHDGTLFNSPTFPNGEHGSAIQFVSASTQYVEVQDHADFNLGSAWTIMCWVKPTLATTTGELVCKQNQWWFSLWLSSGIRYQAGVYKAGGGTQSVIGNNNIPRDAWTHLAYRSTGTNLQMVANGVQDGDSGNVSPYTMDDSANPVRMGSWEGITELLDAAIDDVRIFDVSLTDAQILAYSAISVQSGDDRPAQGMIHSLSAIS